MLKLLLTAAAWLAGSYACYRAWGTQAVLPYIAITAAAFALYVWLANRKPRA